MKKAVVICLILIGIICSERSIGQSLSTELNAMESFWVFGVSFGTKLSQTSKLSFSNTSRFSCDYPCNEELHMLIMTNLGYSITSKLKSTLGEIYTNSSGLRPSVGLQYLVTKKKFLFMIYPNLNMGRKTDLMTMSMIQCLQDLTQKMKFVVRMQSLSILNENGHAFSTTRFRSGFIRGKCQYGVAADLNFFDSNFKFARSFGLFLQYKLL